MPNLAAHPSCLNKPLLCAADGALVADVEGACYIDCTGTQPSDAMARRRVLRMLNRLCQANHRLDNLRGDQTPFQLDIHSDVPVPEILRDHGVLATMTEGTLAIDPPAGMSEQDVSLLCDALWAALHPVAD